VLVNSLFGIKSLKASGQADGLNPLRISRTFLRFERAGKIRSELELERRRCGV